MLAVGAIAAAGCGGSSKTFANKPPPPVTVNLTVYINNARVSVSPGKIGAGPATLIVANHSNSSQSVMIEGAGSNGQAPGSNGQAPVTTGPINPQGTATVNVDLSQPGRYIIRTGQGGGTEAATASPSSSIAPATVTVGAPRPNARGDLNVP